MFTLSRHSSFQNYLGNYPRDGWELVIFPEMSSKYNYLLALISTLRYLNEITEQKVFTVIS